MRQGVQDATDFSMKQRVVLIFHSNPQTSLSRREQKSEMEKRVKKTVDDRGDSAMKT